MIYSMHLKILIIWNWNYRLQKNLSINWLEFDTKLIKKNNHDFEYERFHILQFWKK